jgi:hypothetical protein
MAAPAIPCDSCGSPIPDSDLETGNAITLLGKRYCPGCKTEAIQSVSLDDLAARPAAAAPAARAAAPKAAPAAPAKPVPKAAPPRAPSPAPAPPRPAAPPKAAPPAAPAPAPARPDRKPAPRRPAAAGAKPGSRAPLLIGVVALLVVAAVVGIVLSRGASSPPADPSTGKGSGVGPARGPDRDAQAREAFARVEDVSRRAGTSWDLVLAAADKAKAACRGTEWEKRLEELRARAAREKEAEDAARDLGPLVDELKGAVATDPEFKRYVELQPKFHLALETASRTGSTRRDEIRALQRDYNGKYEKLAEPYFTEINEAALQLAEEKRYDDALRKISTFPQHLRHSGAWTSLEKLKADIERRKQK